MKVFRDRSNDFNAESVALTEYNHPNVLRLVAYTEVAPIYIVTELCVKGDFHDFLTKPTNAPLLLLIRMVMEAAAGMTCIYIISSRLTTLPI